MPVISLKPLVVLAVLKNLPIKSVDTNKFLLVQVASIYLSSPILEFFIAGT